MQRWAVRRWPPWSASTTTARASGTGACRRGARTATATGARTRSPTRCTCIGCSPGDPAVAPIMNALTATSPTSHSGLSDVPLWDSIAAAREYQVTGNLAALRKAEALSASWPTRSSSRSAPARASSTSSPAAAAPSSRPWRPAPTTSRPPLLLYQITTPRSYLTQARGPVPGGPAVLPVPGRPALHRLRVRQRVVLHARCPGRYFGSVNGNMIWAGYYLAQATGQRVLPRRGDRHRAGRGGSTWATPPASTPTCRPRTTSPSRSSRRCTTWPRTATRGSPGAGC